MEQVGWYGFEIATAIIEAVIFFGFIYKVSLGLRRLLYQMLIGMGIYALLIILGDKMEVPPLLKLSIIMLVSGGISYYLFIIEKKKVILAVVYYMTTILVSETLVMGLLMGIHGYEDTNIFLQQNMMHIQGVLIVRIVSVLILYFGIRLFQPLRGKWNRKEAFIIILQTFAYVAVLLLFMELSRVYGNMEGVLPFLFSGMALICIIAYSLCLETTDRYFSSQAKIQEDIRQEEIVKRKQQYLQLKTEADERIQRLYHDMKGHILALEGMQKYHLDGTESYLAEVKKSLYEYETFLDSGCDVLDMVLHERREELLKKEIELDICMEKGCLAGYNPFQLCTIFNNAIDNAAEALLHCDCGEKSIRVDVRSMKKKVGLLFSNACEVPPEKDEKGRLVTRKKNKKLHGIGMKNIREMVMQNNGEISFGWDNGVFELYIVLH